MTQKEIGWSNEMYQEFLLDAATIKEASRYAPLTPEKRHIEATDIAALRSVDRWQGQQNREIDLCSRAEKPR